MKNEDIESYKWVLQTFTNLLSIPLGYKPVIVTDRDLSLLGAIDSLWGIDYLHLLCIWHINKVILA